MTVIKTAEGPIFTVFYQICQEADPSERVGPDGVGNVWVLAGFSYLRERLRHKNSFSISHGKSDIKHQIAPKK